MQDDTTDQEQGGGGGGAAGGTPGAALREALRRARVEAAERSDVVIDLRQAETARLALLRDALAPVFADVPDEIDLFDVGLVAGERPRLFIDMVAFVEMGRDRRLYRFIRDGRHGRTLIVEDERTGPIVAAVTAYVARRLVERERLLADEDGLSAPAATATATAQPVPPAAHREPATARAGPSARVVAPPVAAAETVAEPALQPATRPPRRRWLRALAVVVAFALGGGLGAAVIIALMVAAAKGLLPGVG